MKLTKLSELILHLQYVQEEYGNIGVVTNGYEGGFESAVIDYTKTIDVCYEPDAAWYYGRWSKDSSGEKEKALIL